MSLDDLAGKVSLVSSASTARPGDPLAFSIVNAGSGVVFFGLPYRLERRENGGWAQLPVGPFRLPGFTLGPREQRELSARIPGNATEGRYRITKQVRVGSLPEGRSTWALYAPKESGGVESVNVEISFEVDVTIA